MYAHNKIIYMTRGWLNDFLIQTSLSLLIFYVIFTSIIIVVVVVVFNKKK